MILFDLDPGFRNIFFGIYDQFVADPDTYGELFVAICQVAETRYGLSQYDLAEFLEQRDRLLAVAYETYDDEVDDDRDQEMPF